MKKQRIYIKHNDGETLYKALLRLEKQRRSVYNPEKMPPAMNPEYWRDILDEIGRVRLNVWDALKDGDIKKMLGIYFTEEQAQYVERALREYLRFCEEKAKTEKERERLIFIKDAAKSIELKLSAAFRENNKAAE